jgi:hypothetical protein
MLNQFLCHLLQGMEENPTCPNCGHTMRLVHAPLANEDQHSFQCARCNLIFMTPDHEAVHPEIK